MIEWKKYKNTESCFSIAFREEHPEIAKQLSDAKGFYIEGKKVVVGQYEYSVKKVPNKKQEGKFYTFIERKPYSELGEESENEIASKITKTEYAQKDADRQARIDKAHQENLEQAVKSTEYLERIAMALEKIAQAVDDDGNLHVKVDKSEV